MLAIQIAEQKGWLGHFHNSPLRARVQLDELRVILAFQ
jgi:hypothetical protein